MWTMYDIFFTNFSSVIVFFLVFTCILFATAISRPANLPPGPRSWPIIGNFLSLREDPLMALEDFRREYGDVYTLYLGSQPTVFVHGHKYIREMLVTRGEEFADRPKMFLSEHLCKGRGLSSTSGQLWQEQRRFTLHTLRNFGCGKSSLESKVMEEIEVLIHCLKDKGGETFQISNLIHTSVANIICSIVFGSRFDHDDARFVQYMGLVAKNLEAVGVARPLNYLPWLKYLPGDFFNFHQALRNARSVDQFVLGELQSHRETINPDEPRDFIDAYLVEMDKCQKMDPNTTFQDEQLQQVIVELFGAGFETTATTLLWALLFLVNNPDIQKKLRSEIYSVVGRQRLPSLTDRKHMPYMQATLMEIQRCGDVGPLNVPRCTTQATTLSGYIIPKNTTVISVFSSLHKDPNNFKDPEVFDPNRFLDSDGKVTKSEHLLPFSAGRRVCLGESLARMELFLFLSAMLQKFEFKAPDGLTSLPVDSVLGLVQKPKTYNIRAVFIDTYQNE